MAQPGQVGPRVRRGKAAHLRGEAVSFAQLSLVVISRVRRCDSSSYRFCSGAGHMKSCMVSATRARHSGHSGGEPSIAAHSGEAHSGTWRHGSSSMQHGASRQILHAARASCSARLACAACSAACSAATCAASAAPTCAPAAGTVTCTDCSASEISATGVSGASSSDAARSCGASAREAEPSAVGGGTDAVAEAGTTGSREAAFAAARRRRRAADADGCAAPA